MKYGMTINGFIPKRAIDILSDIKQRYLQTYPDADVSDDSVFVQLAAPIAEKLGELWEMEEAIYNAQYPDSAEGISLDKVCEYNAIERLGAKEAEIICGARGTEGTIVSASLPFQVQNSARTITFQAIQDFTITQNKTLQIKITVSTVANVQYSILIAGYTASTDYALGDTAITIANRLVDAINLNQSNMHVVATLPNILDGTFLITSDTGYDYFAATVTPSLTISDFYTPFRVKNLETGEITAGINTINYILTPVFGLDAVNNFYEAVSGRSIETDVELRLRRVQSIRKIGATTVDAIRSRILQEISGVTGCFVFDNRTDVTDIDGRPPHSFEVLVAGGENQEIGDKIWAVGGAGIQTFGDIAVAVLDSANNPHVVYFTRPTAKYAWARMTLTVDNSYPVGAETQLKSSMISLVDAKFGIGDDIIYQSLYCPIYTIVGVLSAVLEIGTSDDPNTQPASWVQTNIVIESRQYSAWDVDRILISYS